MTRTLVLILALVAALPARAQSLADALAQAWQRHPQAATMTAREQEAAARQALAGGLTPGAPSVSLANLNDRAGSDRGRDEWEVEMAVPLWLPGQKAARETEAERAAAEVAARRSALRLQLAGELREIWWALAAARDASELATRRLATARELALTVQRRYKAGDLSRIDANLAQSEALAAAADQLAASAALLAAEQRYRQLTGAAAPATLAPEQPVAAGTVDADSRGDAGAASTNGHPQLAAAAASAALARARLKLADETRREAPAIALRMVRDRGAFGEAYGNAVGVKLTIPFSSGPRVRQENAAARAEALQAEAELAQAQLGLALAAEKAQRELDAAEQQLAMAGERRALTADNLRLAEKSFALGESDLATLLRARASAFEAEAFFNRQTVDRAAARSRFKQALGVLP